MVPLAYPLVKRLRRWHRRVAAKKSLPVARSALLDIIARYRRTSEKSVSQLQHRLFHLSLIHIRHHSERHLARQKLLLYKLQKLFTGYFLHGCSSAENVSAQGVSLEYHFLELVIDILRRTVLVGLDLVDDHTLLSLDLLLRKCRTCGKLKKQRGRLAQILFQNRRVEYNLFLCRERIQLATQTIEITIYDRGTFLCCSLEQRVLREMCYAAVISCFVPCPAFDAEGTISHGRSAFLHCILQSASCLSAYHPYLLLAFIRSMSSGRNPSPAFFPIRCLLK